MSALPRALPEALANFFWTSSFEFEEDILNLSTVIMDTLFCIKIGIRLSSALTLFCGYFVYSCVGILMLCSRHG